MRTRVLRLFKRSGPLELEFIDNLKAWYHGGGFSIYADVRVPAYDKAGRERLLRAQLQPGRRGRGSSGYRTRSRR